MQGERSSYDDGANRPTRATDRPQPAQSPLCAQWSLTLAWVCSCHLGNPQGAILPLIALEAAGMRLECHVRSRRCIQYAVPRRARSAGSYCQLAIYRSQPHGREGSWPPRGGDNNWTTRRDTTHLEGRLGLAVLPIDRHRADTKGAEAASSRCRSFDAPQLEPRAPPSTPTYPTAERKTSRVREAASKSRHRSRK